MDFDEIRKRVAADTRPRYIRCVVCGEEYHRAVIKNYPESPTCIWCLDKQGKPR